MALRQSVCEKRFQLSSEARQAFDEVITKQFINTTAYQSAQRIAAYMSHNNEVDARKIAQQTWQDGKHCYLPIINPQHKTLDFTLYRADTPLKPNIYGILEPQIKDTCIDLPTLDIVLTPLVAFDRQGKRLGQGAGYYDRSFAFLKHSSSATQIFGLAYELQKVETLPQDPWDVPLNAIVTEKTIYWR